MQGGLQVILGQPREEQRGTKRELYAQSWTQERADSPDQSRRRTSSSIRGTVMEREGKYGWQHSAMAKVIAACMVCQEVSRKREALSKE